MWSLINVAIMHGETIIPDLTKNKNKILPENVIETCILNPNYQSLKITSYYAFCRLFRFHIVLACFSKFLTSFLSRVSMEADKTP